MDVFDQITKFANTASTNVNDSIRENLTSTSDQVLDVVLDTNRRMVDLAVSTVDRISAQIDLDVPFADRFPTPSAAGERYLDFVEQAVSLNREMTQRVVEMLEAAERRAVDATAEQAAARKTAAKKPMARTATAKKTAAKKSTARKSTARKSTKKVAKKPVAKPAAAASA